jgi:branched-chain amino acid transport system ATP-binding protein
MTILEIEGVNTFRGPAHVLNGVSLNVGEQEVVCLVGRNGAGKTTTIESINGLLPMRSGTIRFRGEEISRLPAHRRAQRGIGYAPEGAHIFPDLTVAENLMISRWLSEKSVKERGGDQDATERRIFALFPEMSSFLGRRGLNLSGGQKKMVAIARAMALSPFLLLLDEAFEGLAPKVVGRFRETIMAIKQMGVSILIAESNLVNAAAVADRLYAIDRGEIIFHGSPQEALANEDVMRTLRG